MTPKAIRDAVVELRDMAMGLDRENEGPRGFDMESRGPLEWDRGRRSDRAKMLRDVAAILDKLPVEA